MDEGDRVPLVDSDFPEDTLQEKSTNMVQVETQRLKKWSLIVCMTSYLPI